MLQKASRCVCEALSGLQDGLRQWGRSEDLGLTEATGCITPAVLLGPDTVSTEKSAVLRKGIYQSASIYNQGSGSLIEGTLWSTVCPREMEV